MRRKVMVVVAICCVGGCDDSASRTRTTSGDTATRPGAVDRVAALPMERYDGIGRVPSDAELRAWDIDVNPRGDGLPAGHGTYGRGAAVYRQRCAACHGVKGEGVAPNPRLVGREPGDFSFARVGPGAARTIGNYWPYATTLFDYINRAMPFDAPGSLPPGDVYSVVAYLLAENRIIDTSRVLDARSLPGVVMPARDRFVPDDRTGGSAFR